MSDDKPESNIDTDGSRRRIRPPRRLLNVNTSSEQTSSISKNQKPADITPCTGDAHVITSGRSVQSGMTFVTPSYSNIFSSKTFFPSSPPVQNINANFTLVGHIPSNVSPSPIWSMPPPRLTYSEIIKSKSPDINKPKQKCEKSPSKKKHVVKTLTNDPTSAENAKGVQKYNHTADKLTNEQLILSNEPSTQEVDVDMLQRRERVLVSRPQHVPSIELDTNEEAHDYANQQLQIHPRKRRAAYIPSLDSIYRQEDVILFSPAYSDKLKFTAIKEKKSRKPAPDKR